MGVTKEKYDFLIVGAGLFGATFAHMVRQSDVSCLVIDKRDHVAGNCHVETMSGIEVHKYGPHIFHTKDIRIWNFVNSFSQFNTFRYRVKASNKGRLYSFPINLTTMHDLWGVKTPKDARTALSKRVWNYGSNSLEDWCMLNIGEELYNLFIKHYTFKQWGIDPKRLPSSIVKRVPLKFTYSDYYYDDWEYQGIPAIGYTNMVKHMLHRIPVELSVDYLSDREALDRVADKVLFTGSVDEFFGNSHGPLPYRSLRFFERSMDDIDDFQGIAGINYTDLSTQTRDIEYKHFKNTNVNGTVVVREFPSSNGEPFYPIPLQENIELYGKYVADAGKHSKYLFGGRLGSYEYLNMDQTILRALSLARNMGFYRGGI